ncbi:MAG TPA: HNH endonuclease signature motif containing protein [Anaerolineae bacterium]|jgi:hypothetical protein
MTYIPVALRELVIQWAGDRCEYCLYPQDLSFLSFEVEHIIAEKHGCETIAENLVLACPYCNRFKGSDIGSLDPTTGNLTLFYNPRTQEWSEHFQLNDAQIAPITPEGRVIVQILQLNHPDRIEERRHLIHAGRYPG